MTEAFREQKAKNWSTDDDRTRSLEPNLVASLPPSLVRRSSARAQLYSLLLASSKKTNVIMMSNVKRKSAMPSTIKKGAKGGKRVE